MNTLEITSEMMQNAMVNSLPKILEDLFGSSYSSPFRKVLEEELKKQEGTIRVMVSEVVASAMSDAKFKEQLGQIVLRSLVEKGLGK